VQGIVILKISEINQDGGIDFLDFIYFSNKGSLFFLNLNGLNVIDHQISVVDHHFFKIFLYKKKLIQKIKD